MWKHLEYYLSKPKDIEVDINQIRKDGRQIIFESYTFNTTDSLSAILLKIEVTKKPNIIYYLVRQLKELLLSSNLTS